MANDTTYQGFDTLTTLSHPNHSPISAALTSQNHDIIEAAAAPACVTPPFSTSSTSSCNGPSCSTSSASSSTFDPISIDCSTEVSSSPPLRLGKGKFDPTIIGFKRAENGGLMRMQGLMKLRRQGSQPPCSLRNKQARELLASLQRLSLKEDDTAEAHNSLLLKKELEGSLVNNERRPSTLLRSKPELPFSAKIAAAMDADGLIGVEKHISDHNAIAIISQAQTQAANHHINSALHSEVSKNRRCSELSRGEKSGRRRSSIKRRSGCIVLRRLRTSRSLLGKIWKNIRRAFSSPSKRWLHRELLKDSI